jgi:uncharacterized protein
LHAPGFVTVWRNFDAKTNTPLRYRVFEVEDILGSEERAVIVGELATRIKSSGKVNHSQFAIILTISGDTITRFQMLEDSFDLSRTVRG